MPPVLNLLSAERLQTVIFKKPENFKKHSCLLMNAVREGFKALGQELSGKSQILSGDFCK